MVEAGADVVGLLVMPDDDAFIARLMRHYGRFGFRPLEDVAEEPNEDAEKSYPIMVLPLGACVNRAKRF